MGTSHDSSDRSYCKETEERMSDDKELGPTSKTHYLNGNYVTRVVFEGINIMLNFVLHFGYLQSFLCKINQIVSYY